MAPEDEIRFTVAAYVDAHPRTALLDLGAVDGALEAPFGAPSPVATDAPGPGSNLRSAIPLSPNPNAY